MKHIKKIISVSVVLLLVGLVVPSYSNNIKSKDNGTVTIQNNLPEIDES